MKIRSLIYLLVILFLFIGSTCDKNAPEAESTEVENNKAKHPRIMLLKGEEKQIKELIASDATWKKMHDAIIGECNVIITKPELERVMVGRRLLGTSRVRIPYDGRPAVPGKGGERDDGSLPVCRLEPFPFSGCG